jgi:hypothetical protein
MKSSGFILYFALVAVLILFACVQPPQSGGGKAGAVCDSDAIAAKVVELDPPFDAQGFGDCDAKGSSCDVPPTGTSRSAFAAKITAAFNIAPVFFQNELCGFDKIYIVTRPELQSNPTAWGMRQRLKDNKKHIGISSVVWTSPAPAASYIAYENGVLDRLLEHLWPPPQGPSYTAAVTDSEGARDPRHSRARIGPCALVG